MHALLIRAQCAKGVSDFDLQKFQEKALALNLKCFYIITALLMFKKAIIRTCRGECRRLKRSSSLR